MKYSVRYVDLNGRGKVLRRERELDRGAMPLHANQADGDGENIFVYPANSEDFALDLTPRQAKRLAAFITEVYKKA